jgi:hypothetical protein
MYRIYYNKNLKIIYIDYFKYLQYLSLLLFCLLEKKRYKEEEAPENFI